MAQSPLRVQPGPDKPNINPNVTSRHEASITPFHRLLSNSAVSVGDGRRVHQVALGFVVPPVLAPKRVTPTVRFKGNILKITSDALDTPLRVPSTLNRVLGIMAIDDNLPLMKGVQPLQYRSISPESSSSQWPVEQLEQGQPKISWKSYFWDTLDKSPEERRFLFKIDAALLTMASLGYFIKYLDQININSAFVSGMKEDFGLNGNQLNYMITSWIVGYVIGEIPR